MAAARDDEATEIAALHATVAELRADNTRLRAQLPSPQWMPLKLAASLCDVGYETCRSWLHAGLIGSHRDGGRLLVDLGSLRNRVAMLRGGRRAG